jgi:hypothetical protein
MEASVVYNSSIGLDSDLQIRLLSFGRIGFDLCLQEAEELMENLQLYIALVKKEI